MPVLLTSFCGWCQCQVTVQPLRFGDTTRFQCMSCGHSLYLNSSPWIQAPKPEPAPVESE